MLTNTPLSGGLHPETAALSHLLAGQGICNPLTGQPLSEALLLGINGGLGLGYILWEFQRHQLRIVTLGFTNRWNYRTAALERVTARLGLTAQVFETHGAVTAARQLKELLQAGRAAIASVDLAQLPYYGLPRALDGCLGHAVGVVGWDEAHAYLDDRGLHPVPIAHEALAAARGRIASFRHHLLAVSGEINADIEAAIRMGIDDHIDHLARKSDSFALPAIAKWARLINDDRHAKGWRRVFADRRSLFSALLSVYEATQPGGSGGGALRGLYADFLDEAAALLGWPALAAAAAPYRNAEKAWRRLGQSCLPEFVSSFGQVKGLLQRRSELILTGAHTSDQLAELNEVNVALVAFRAELDQSWPLGAAATEVLLTELAARLADIHTSETDALTALAAARSPLFHD